MDAECYEKIEPQERSTRKQFVLGLIAYFSSVAPSMSLGFSAVALPGLQDEDNPYKLTISQASWFASIASIATPLGCLISGPISDKFGRKAAVLCVNVVTFIGWIILALAYQIPQHQYPLLLVGRLITGLSTGLASMPSVVYMAEISSSKLRGMFTTASAIFFSIGVLVVYILGYFMQNNWGKIALATAFIPCLAMFLAILFMPESPQWLVSKNRESEAKWNLTKIYGFERCTSEIHEEVELLVANRERSKIEMRTNKSCFSTISKKLKYLTSPSCYKPFFIISAYFFFLQFSGTFVVIFYAIDIVKQAGVLIDSYLAIVMIGLTRLTGAIIVSGFSKKYGRRPPSIISGVGMTVCMAILCVYLHLLNRGAITPETAKSLSWLPVSMLIIYFFTSTLGFLTVPFAMAAEVFPTKIRGFATGLVTCLAYSFNFVTVKTYPVMIDSMGNDGVFCFYGAMSLAGTIFVITLLPETKGKTLQEIEEYFDGNRRQENNSKSVEFAQDCKR